MRWCVRRAANQWEDDDDVVAAETGITVSCDEGSSPICFDRVGCETSQSRKKTFFGGNGWMVSGLLEKEGCC